MWDRFAEKNNPEFEDEFEFTTKNGKKATKSIPSSDSIIGENLHTILEEIGSRKLEDVLLIFYKDKQPEVATEIAQKFSTVFVQYNPTFGRFTELE